jgi:hypothetical protein
MSEPHKDALNTRKKTELAASTEIANGNAPLAPFPSEAKAIADAQDRMAGRRPRIEASVKTEDGVMKIGAPHSDAKGFVAQLYDCFGTASAAFAEQAVARLVAVISRKGSASPTQTELNAALAAIGGIRPADEIEAMLAVQMVATYETAMDMLTRAKHAGAMPHLQECGSLAVKLLRTYTVQLEALARRRRGGEQRVIVQHVNVNEGGQAIVGAVSHPGDGKK